MAGGMFYDKDKILCLDAVTLFIICGTNSINLCTYTCSIHALAKMISVDSVRELVDWRVISYQQVTVTMCVNVMRKCGVTRPGEKVHPSTICTR